MNRLLTTLLNLFAARRLTATSTEAPDDTAYRDDLADANALTPDDNFALSDWTPTDGLFLDIEYAAASGELTRRQITVWALREKSPGLVLLMARCHLRKSTRTFRADRIISIYEDKHPIPATSLLNELLADYGVSSIAFSLPQPKPPWHSLRRQLRAELHLLTSLARADGRHTSEETRAIADFAVSVTGFTLSDADRADFEAYLGRLRPTAAQLDKARDHLLSLTEDECKRFARAASRVAESDGVLHESEALWLLDLKDCLNP